MMEYYELNALRRGSYLVRHADEPRPVILNALVYLVLVVLVIAAIGSIF